MIQVAIDGPAGAGKSVISKLVAEKLKFIHVDTGALYRGMAVYFRENNVDYKDENSLKEALNKFDIKIEFKGDMQHVILNGVDITSKLRDEEIGQIASVSSAMQCVRDKVTDIQRNIANENNVIMDGRDIGSVILPNATVKIFLTASAKERANRRYKELIEKNIEADYDTIYNEIVKRDEQDSTRKVSPLIKADDAIELDTSDLTIEQVIDKIIEIINKGR